MVSFKDIDANLLQSISKLIKTNPLKYYSPVASLTKFQKPPNRFPPINSINPEKEETFMEMFNKAV